MSIKSSVTFSSFFSQHYELVVVMSPQRNRLLADFSRVQVQQHRFLTFHKWCLLNVDAETCEVSKCRRGFYPNTTTVIFLLILLYVSTSSIEGDIITETIHPIAVLVPVFERWCWCSIVRYFERTPRTATFS